MDDFISADGFFNTIQKGTRFNEKKNLSTLLDVILCYNSNHLISSEVLACPFSDHSLGISVLDFNKSPKHKELNSIRCLNSKTLETIKSSLSLIFLTLISVHNDVNSQWGLIRDILLSIIDSKAPLKLVPVKPINRVPWLDKDLVCLGKQRDRLYNKARRSNLRDDWNLYKLVRNTFTSLFKYKKILHFNNFINNTSTSTKKLWNKLSPILNPNRKTSLSPSLIMKNTSNNSISDLTNVFCNFFTSVLNKFTFVDYNICIKYIDNLFFSISSLSSFLLTSSSKFDIDRFEIEEVVKTLESIDGSSASGAVNISSVVFKKCADELGPVLTNLFNLCLEKSEIPIDWKMAYITPIYKGKGIRSDLNNYRPISVISPIAKVFEILVAKKMKHYLESNGILHDSQFGFRAGRSCELALNTIVEDWREDLDDNREVVAVFLDLSKAFDTVDHQLLLKKMHFYNFSSKFVKLITNYLTDRAMKVKIDGCLSKSEPLKVGVPQGSVLGPLLFIVYINDLCHLPLKSKILLFADDTTFYLSGLHLNQVLEQISKDMQIVKEWLSNNRLILNISKTHAMHLSNKSNSVSDSNLFIEFDDEKIGFVTETKILGVILDNKLKFSSHIYTTCNKINSKSFLLSRSLHLFSTSFRPILFKLFIQSYFDYCSSLFLHSNKADRNRLEKSFNKSIYRLLKLNIFTLNSSQQLTILSKFKILPSLYRQLFHFTNFLFKIVTYKNSSLYNKIMKYSKSSKSTSSNNRCTRYLYDDPSFKTNFYKFSFTRISIKFLNNFLLNKKKINLKIIM
ncbi:MAG: hypothetical protein QG594_1963 [Bacteroidota bacterium]|nr:hypothetical protein [Bacteroidota bacterium]